MAPRRGGLKMFFAIPAAALLFGIAFVIFTIEETINGAR